MNNSFIKLWNIFIIFLQVFSSLMYVYFSAFKLKTGDNPFFVIDTVTTIVESLFLIDMLLYFFKEYIPDNTAKPVNSFPAIIEHYIKSGFVTDLIPLAPL